MTMIEAFRDRLESLAALYEGQAEDREEWVFNGWTTYENVAAEIRFFRDSARNCRYLLIIG